METKLKNNNEALEAILSSINDLPTDTDTYREGYDNGKAAGREEGIAEGRQAEYDAFWDTLQQNGERHDYYFGFAGRIWINSFAPKYSIRPNNAAYIFGYWDVGGAYEIDFVELCEELGIEVDFSQTTSIGNAFASNTVFNHIGVVDIRKATAAGGLFGYCTRLHTIDKLILKEDGTNTFNSTSFGKCPSLVNITIEGTIGKTIEFTESKLLSNASVQSIINALKDLTNSSAQTITFHADVKAKLTDNQIAQITAKNWNLA